MKGVEFSMTFETELDVMMESANIDIMRAESDFNKAHSLYILESKKDKNADQPVEPVVSEKQKSAFRQTIDKIFETIVRVFKNLVSAFGSLFKSSDSITAEEYFGDPNVQIMLDEDINKISERVDDELRKGKKFLQMLSRGTHIPDKELEKYLNAGGEILAERGPGFVKLAISGTSALVTRKNVKKKVSEYGNKAREYHSLASSADPTTQKQAVQIFGHMNKLSSFFANRVGKYFKKIEDRAAARTAAHYDSMSNTEKAKKKAEKERKKIEKNENKKSLF